MFEASFFFRNSSHKTDMSSRVIVLGRSTQCRFNRRYCLDWVCGLKEKCQNIFEIGLKKLWSVRSKIVLIQKIFRKKKFKNKFLLFLLFMC